MKRIFSIFRRRYRNPRKPPIHDYPAHELARCSFCKSGPWHFTQMEPSGLCPECYGG